MKKTLLVIALVAAAALALGTASLVYAQTPAAAGSAGQGYGPEYGQGYGPEYGQGTRGAGRGQGGMMGGTGAQSGILHDAMIAGFAQELGITVEDLNARLAGGETIYQIAAASGLTSAEFTSLMTTVRGQAIDQALANGDLTQEQADWMKQRGGMLSGAGANGSGARGSGMRGGMHGAGQGTYVNCPAASATTAP